MLPKSIITGVRPLNIPDGNQPLEVESATFLPPEFPRAPRDYMPAPDDEVSILLPPAQPSPPTNSLITVFVSFMSAAIMGGIYIFSANASGKSGPPPMAYASLIIGGLTLTMGLYAYFSSQRKYKQQVEQRQKAYEMYLAQKSKQLSDLSGAQREASLAAHPSMEACVQISEKRAPTQLWDRENGDPDFLDVRLGIGESLPTFKIKISSGNQFQISPDPLEQKAQALEPNFSRIANHPVTLPLAKLGPVGWLGAREDMVKSLRAFILHLTTHHAPNEVKLVVLCPEDESVEWNWVRWLPHNWSDGRELRFFGNSKASQATVMAYLENIIKQRTNQLATQTNSNSNTSLPGLVYIVILGDVMLWRGAEAIKFAPLIDLMVKNSQKLGIFPVFLSGQVSRVPKDCNAMVNIQNKISVLKFLGTSPQKFPFAPDMLDLKTAWGFSQNLAPVRLEETGGATANLPGSIPLLELIAVARVEDINVLQLWKESQPTKTLAVPVGVGSGGKRLVIDLHEKKHGPHGLVAGTTGSGKTALLSTYLALASLYYHPHELAFIGIDFKGGDLIRELKDLPHMVGSMTNLEGSGTERAIKILRGEIKNRQTRFNRAGIGNIYDYQAMYRGQDALADSPMPHLLIVCDEFAELKKEQPDFIRELVSISRVGRSLGIHLILATQKPAGVVSDEIWSNSHFHLCLKVASLEDSREMLRRTEAADITQKGRAYFQVGMNEQFELFQAAWGDAPYVLQETNTRQVRIREVQVDGSREDLWPPQNRATETGKTQIQALTQHIVNTCKNNNIPRLKGIWPASLTEQKDRTLKEILPARQGWDGKSWLAPASHFRPLLGILDNPDLQRQELLRIDLEADGHFALFGSPGSGKTSALQTLIISLACEHTPAQANIYILDYAGRNFGAFESLPHVGAVITNGETERLRRLFTCINTEIERRKKLVENDQNLINYRKNHPQNDEAEIFIFLDGFSQFVEAFKQQTTTTEMDNLARIASQGGNLGIHLLLASDQVKTFPSRLLGSIKIVTAVELNDVGDYSAVLGRTGGLYPPKDSPGRGLIKKQPVMEFLAALPYESSLDLRRMAEEMQTAWQGKCPLLVPALPELVTLSDMPAPAEKYAQPRPGLPVTIGLNLSFPTLPPYEISLAPNPHFWVTGQPQSGKTSLLQTWLLSLAENYPAQVVRFVLVDLGWGGFETIKSLPHTLHCITDASEFKTISLQKELEQVLAVDMSGPRPVALDDPSRPSVILAVDGMGAFAKALTSDYSDKEKVAEKNRDYLLALLRIRNARFHLLASGVPNEFGGGMSSNPIGETLRGFQNGFWVGDGTNGDASGFNFQFAPGEIIKGLPRGSAFQVNRGGFSVLRLATCQAGSPRLEERIEAVGLKAH